MLVLQRLLLAISTCCMRACRTCNHHHIYPPLAAFAHQVHALKRRRFSFLDGLKVSQINSLAWGNINWGWYSWNFSPISLSLIIVLALNNNIRQCFCFLVIFHWITLFGGVLVVSGKLVEWPNLVVRIANLWLNEGSDNIELSWQERWMWILSKFNV